MKVYGAPAHITLTPDYSNYNRAEEEKKEAAYKEAIKADLIGTGFKGPNTGRIVRFGVADGYAQYMFADGGNGRTSFATQFAPGGSVGSVLSSGSAAFRARIFASQAGHACASTAGC